MEWAVECKGLTKRFKEFPAVDRVDLKLEADKIYGLVGRNGAGKTTLLNLFTTFLFPTDGKVLVFGQNPEENTSVLDKICMVKEKNHFIKDMRVKEILDLAEGFYPYWDREFAARLLEVFELDGRKLCKKLSRGMESLLGNLIGLASRSPLTIFDEPSLGLDAVNRQHFYDLLVDDFTSSPRTVIISTHLIDEVSSLFEEILIMDRGEIKLKEETEALRQQAFYLNGKTEIVDQIAGNLKVLHGETYGKTSIKAVWGSLDDESRKLAEEYDVENSLIPVQKLFVYLAEIYKQEGQSA